MTTKRIRSDPTLGALVTSRARVEILKLLMLNPGDRRYLREVASLTHQPLRAAQRELARLEGAGLLTATTEGNRKYYQANRHSPIFPEVKALLIKTVGLGDLFRQYLQDRRDSIQLAFLFGSYARGTEGSASDIDLMVVGEITGRELARLLAPVRETSGREVNTVCMTPAEFRAKARQGTPFLQEILRGAKVFLIGGEYELGG
ncbi:MAG: nucleotidyltransferase domain-containing protein, partial [Anaerolineales bacterium]